MPKVIRLGIAKNKNQKIQEVEKIELLSGKGIVGNRHFHENNDARCQITLIESENIDYYNNKFKTDYSYVDFRRNVVTKGIQLNDLVGKKLLIGNVEVQGHDLCRPCKHLEETLKAQDIIKEFLRRGGLRCEIINSGIVNIGDEIKVV
jgi:MOSC domain-containing protein YiiM|tara:strand:- start:3791 stop:4234 length:444 start_codon:yes stop_codon:yes gene_type:complete